METKDFLKDFPEIKTDSRLNVIKHALRYYNSN